MSMQTFFKYKKEMLQNSLQISKKYKKKNQINK